MGLAVAELFLRARRTTIVSSGGRADHYSGLGGHGDCIAPVSIIVLVMFVEPERSQSSPRGEKKGTPKIGDDGNSMTSTIFHC